MMAAEAVVSFGRFTLDPARRELTADGVAVPLSSRAYDILALLIAHRDRVVTKDEIFARVWPGVTVEENNLAVQISALRRAMGEGGALVKTVPGRGYRFVGQVADRAAPAPPAALPDIAAPPPARPRRRLVPAGLAAALLVAGLGVALLWPRHASPPRAPSRLSLAVLPFRNLGGERADDDLADAVSDDLTTDLAQIPGSVVIARESSDIYRGRAVPTPEIGRALNVRYLLEGSLRGADGEYSINAQLIEAATGAHVWAQRFQVPRARISETQQAIVGQIASALNVQLVAAAARAPFGTGPGFDELYRARSILDRSDTLPSMAEAQGLLERARAARPDDPAILVELAKTLLRKIDGAPDPDETRDRAEARAVIAAAAGVAPGNPEVMSARAFLLADDGDCTAALKIFQEVLATYANSTLARSGLAHCYTKLNRNEEAAAAWRELLRIDPFGPSSRARAYQLGRALLFLGRPEEALTWLDRAEAEDTPDGRLDSGRREWGTLYRIAALEMSGEHARAAALWRDFDAAWPHRTTWRLISETRSAEVRRSPGFQAFLAALHRAGMPDHAPEDAGGVAEDAPDPGGDDFAPSPRSVAGHDALGTAGLAALAPRGPLIWDVGLCDASVPGAIAWRGAAEAAAAEARRTAAGRPLVIMGDGPYGWDSYRLARALLRAGVPNVFWYRGGEEAWAASGQPRRPCAGAAP